MLVNKMPPAVFFHTLAPDCGTRWLSVTSTAKLQTNEQKRTSSVGEGGVYVEDMEMRSGRSTSEREKSRPRGRRARAKIRKGV